MENSEKRRFPMEDNFMKGNKDVSKSKPNDVLYGYLQMISTYRKEDNIRFVYKKDYSHMDIERHFGVDEKGKPIFPRKSAERAMRVLIQYGYVREVKVMGLKNNLVPAYELPYDVTETFQYINLDTLKYLLEVFNPNVIKLYIFLKYKHFCHSNNFVFTKKMLLKECFGVSSNTNKTANDKLKTCLDVLAKVKLIKWCNFTILNDNGQPVPQMKLTYFSDVIKFENQIE